MANQHGGYRKPSKPAPASGPGQLSRRTDGGPQPQRDLPNAGYGENADFKTAQSGAPMAGRMPMPNGPTPSAGGAAPPQPPVEVTPMDAPTQRPGEPITAGAPMGEGVGPEALGLRNPQDEIDRTDATRLMEYLPVLEFLANRPGSSAAMRAYVRQIKALNL